MNETPALPPHKLLTPRQQLMVVFLLAFGNFMVMLDLTIANVSIPQIAGNLGTSMDQGAWVITSYAVAEAICVPLTGWLAKRFGVVRVFTASMFGFGLFSLLCGLAPTLGMLVACRIGQGLAGAPIMPASQALLYRLFEPKRRAWAMAIWTMTISAGPAVGPVLGGHITDNFSWHWIFLINVPIAIACASAAIFLLRRAETPTERRSVDVVGLGLLVFWIGCIQLMLDLGSDRDWFGDWKIVALAIGGFLGFCLFVIWELTEDHPVVDLRIFRHRGFTVAVLTLAVGFGSYFAGVVMIPQWLQSSMGYPAATAGMILAISAVTSILGGTMIGSVAQRVDPRLLISSGLLIAALCTFARSFWSTDSSFWGLLWPQLVQGMAMPFIMIPLTMTSMSSVNPDETASAAGMQAFLRTICVAIATSLMMTYWGHGQRVATDSLVGSIDPINASATLGSVGLGGEQMRAILGNLVDVQARTLGMSHAFVVTAAIQVVIVAFIWLAPRSRVRGAGNAAAAH